MGRQMGHHMLLLFFFSSLSSFSELRLSNGCWKECAWLNTWLCLREVFAVAPQEGFQPLQRITSSSSPRACRNAHTHTLTPLHWYQRKNARQRYLRFYTSKAGEHDKMKTEKTEARRLAKGRELIFKRYFPWYIKPRHYLWVQEKKKYRRIFSPSLFWTLASNNLCKVNYAKDWEMEWKWNGNRIQEWYQVHFPETEDLSLAVHWFVGTLCRSITKPHIDHAEI